TVAPVLGVGGVTAHLVPVGVVVPLPLLHVGLDPDPHAPRTVGARSGLDDRPASGGIVASHAGAEVVDRSTVLVDLHVHANEKTLVTLVQQLIEMSAGIGLSCVLPPDKK